MRRVFLIALREYHESARTKGFWIGLFLLPLFVIVGLLMMSWLDRATPIRYIAVNDQSGRYLSNVQQGMERLHQRDTLRALSEYAQKYTNRRRWDGPAVNPSRMPSSVQEDLFAQFLDTEEALDRFIGQGGTENALNTLAPYLSEDAPAFKLPKRRYQVVPLPDDVTVGTSLDEAARLIKPYLNGNKPMTIDGQQHDLFAFIQIPANIDDTIVRPYSLPSQGSADGVQYWSTNLADSNPGIVVEKVINEEARRREYIARGMDARVVSEVERTYVPFVTLNPKKEEGTEQVNVADRVRQWAPLAFDYLLWIAISTISPMLLNNTIEEKSNRTIEVLLSSVTASELMLGKLVGIASIGLTMLAAWIASLFLVALLFFLGEPDSDMALAGYEALKTSRLLPMFAIYFILGYLLYASVFLAIGSVCNTLKEAQNLVGPVMLIFVFPLFSMRFIAQDPNGTLATVMSWVPFYTPFAMINRAAAYPPAFDIVGTMVVLVITTCGVMFLAGRVFRIGILRLGQPPRFRELWRLVREY